MSWSDIPSLSALRAFEATARLGSFSAAARELNVTHAAISQHVRGLETFFGEALLDKAPRGFLLTEQGQILARALAEGFSTIKHGVRLIEKSHSDRPLRISTTSGFAEKWLMPRLKAFWELHPDIDVVLESSAVRDHIGAGGLDLAIRYGTGDWEGLSAAPLLESPFHVVASPQYHAAGTLDDLGPLDRLIWVFSQYSIEQFTWGPVLGLDFKTVPFRSLNTNAIALSAIRSGLGISLQVELLIKEDLESGQMVSFFRHDPMGLGYHIVTPPGALSPKVKTLRNWLLKVAQRAA
ncbi:LysR family transcriptional regulator [Celeribacter neptunius]|uniref:LysR family transcriptional regulator, glycine cleavage system transcriptional activator n=1 Tax=Celeribacter neptunius TaxID=588602 RepID=A0A1I3SG05_9RHOB|nr:LysR family transcriptional regulator [Celeribacter neptunius]SFJ57724.1 LysR family transcriptional regulator, glycine cleavage system transcriptional activator [Celeribacter neptunius]